MLWAAFSIALVAASTYNVTRIKNLNITTFDNVMLRAGVSVPVPLRPDERFPVVVFTNSWGIPKFEYLLDTVQLAEMGYVVLEYEARGWYQSGGEIGTAGPLDQRDSSTVIDYVLSHAEWRPDPSRIAMAGISYGGGLALLAAANDPRVTTAVAMSGWSDIYKALDEGESPCLVWGSLLVALAEVAGHEDPELAAVWADLLTHTNMSAVGAFADARSPARARFLDAINGRRVPIFLSNNFEDELFKPQDQLDFFQSLLGPKQLLLNQGIHATAELGGLIDIASNFVWQNVVVWLNHFLRDGPAPPLGTATFQTRALEREHLQFPSWPAPNVTTTPFFLSPRVGPFAQYGGLGASPSSSKDVNSITFSKDPWMNAGVPVLGELFQVFADVPILADLSLVPGAHAVLWRGEELKSATRLCGNVKLTIPVTTTFTRWQLAGYLYKEDALGVGVLLSHGTRSCWDCPGSSTAKQQTEIILRTICHDVQKGERIVIGVDMHSNLYKTANEDPRLELTFSYGPTAKLELDIVH